jgi:Natural resistance-associated macrophage protein
VYAGSLFANMIAVFIVIATAATLFPHHQAVQTAQDAARALGPIAGSYAKYLFAIGLFGASMLAAAVLPLATAYSIAEAMGVEKGVNHRPLTRVIGNDCAPAIRSERRIALRSCDSSWTTSAMHPESGQARMPRWTGRPRSLTRRDATCSYPVGVGARSPSFGSEGLHRLFEATFVQCGLQCSDECIDITLVHPAHMADTEYRPL